MERSVSASKWTLGGWVGKWGLGMELDFQSHFWCHCHISCTQDVTSSLPWHDGELCFLQNGTSLLEATVPHSAIEFICNMTGRQRTQTCLQPSDFGWLSQGIFPLCMQPPLWSGKKSNQVYLLEKYLFAGLSSKGSLWVFIASAWTITSPIAFLIEPESTRYYHTDPNSQIRLYGSPYSQEPRG